MVFITHCRSPQFRQELRRHGVGVTWQFIRKEAQGWDRSERCEEQSNEKAFTVKRNTQKAQNRSQAKNQCPNNASPKKELADAFFQGKCSTVHSVKDCKVSAEVVCRNCSKTGHLAKICASHIFSPLTSEQQRRRRMVANLIEQGESSDEDANEASALAVSRRVSNASPVYRC